MEAKKVLVVDDDDDIREILVEVLNDEGFSAASAENGQEALVYLEGHGAPCVIVLDLMMPVMSGAEFRERQLAEPRFASIPVIVLSAADRGSSLASDMRADAFVPKPPSVRKLVEMVARYC